MKKILIYPLLLLFLIIVVIAIRMNWLGTRQVVLPSGETVDPKELSSAEVLSVVAEQMNQVLPIKVGTEIELRSVEGRQGELIYHYVKTTPPSELFDKNRFMEEIRPIVLRRACRSQGMKLFFAHGVCARYDFRAENDQFIGEIIVTPRQCGY
ncbi:conserved hypothetical protein [Nitrosococcus halophilus Nc 4]|uniref:Uncharacterized protein n=1 Tax=Nitrosococcus halophilus (strain Nc4) TaxID=472759 RepID=D5C3M8_NITHN|nr:conserved hypothetical protein [Nitrosococcus halophilus Nc 4]